MFFRTAFLPKNISLNTSRFFSESAKKNGVVSIKRSVLDNGVTVISGAKPNDTLESVGVYVNTGSAFENHKTHGSAHYLRRFLFKSTNRLSGLRLTRTIESVTASFDAYNEPECLTYKSLFPVDQLNNVMVVMGDILRPRLAEWEFRDVRNLVKHDIQERSSCQLTDVIDKVRHTAYGGCGLGRSPLCPSYNVNEIYPEDLAEYILARIVGSNITVIGSVDDHDAFASAVINGFGALPKESTVQVPELEKSTYYGGSTFISDGPGSVYVEAYKGVDAKAGSKESYAQLILLEILGNYSPRGAKNFTRLSGLEGSDISSANVFSLNDSQSIVGVHATGGVQCSEIAEKIHQQLESISKISDSEFEAAKNYVAVRNRLDNEKRSNVLDVVHKFSPDFDSKDFGEITKQDVESVANQLLSSKPTIYASGDLKNMPSFTF